MSGGRAAGFHEDYRREEDGKGPTERSFGLTLGILALLVAGLMLWRQRLVWALALGAVGALLVLLALAAPALLRPLNRLWTRFGLLLHAVVTPLVMALLFYLTVTPVGLLMRLLGKDLAHPKVDRAAATYWIARQPPGPPPETMRRQF
ncbi:MAG TPA: hypothetical protein VMQ73_07630 [Methylomirabilota bacterium]|nr:hypothetical protein [Methylomirabilota bacterium]